MTEYKQRVALFAKGEWKAMRHDNQSGQKQSRSIEIIFLVTLDKVLEGAFQKIQIPVSTWISHGRVGDNAEVSALGFRVFTSAATGAEDFFAMRVKGSDFFVPALN
jgi:hypothetical protein